MLTRLRIIWRVNVYILQIVRKQTFASALLRVLRIESLKSARRSRLFSDEHVMRIPEHNVNRRGSDVLPTHVFATLGHYIFQSRVFSPSVFAVFAVSLPVVFHMCNTGPPPARPLTIDGTAGTLPVIVATLGEPLSVSAFFPSREIPRRICEKKISQAYFDRLTRKSRNLLSLKASYASLSCLSVS